uniref:Uncharacterized protein n=1 Tax=Leersia perrieri TaxID=77586 RepID=A0A0D9XHK9_9ORYZ
MELAVSAVTRELIWPPDSPSRRPQPIGAIAMPAQATTALANQLLATVVATPSPGHRHTAHPHLYQPPPLPGCQICFGERCRFVVATPSPRRMPLLGIGGVRRLQRLAAKRPYVNGLQRRTSSSRAAAADEWGGSSPPRWSDGRGAGWLQ